jgi:hypothetical protein
MIAQDGSIADKSKLLENDEGDGGAQEVAEDASGAESTSTGFIMSHPSATSIASSTESSAGLLRLESF